MISVFAQIKPLHHSPHTPLLNHKHTLWLSSCILFAASPARYHVHEACTETWGGAGGRTRRSGLRLLMCFPLPMTSGGAEEEEEPGVPYPTFGGSSGDWVRVEIRWKTGETFFCYFWHFNIHAIYQVRLWKRSRVDCIDEVILDMLKKKTGWEK